jgi:hypothetical protein
MPEREDDSDGAFADLEPVDAGEETNAADDHDLIVG